MSRFRQVPGIPCFSGVMAVLLHLERIFWRTMHYHALRRGEVIHQVCVGGVRTVLLRSDGCAVACGEHLDIPSLEEGQSCPHRFLQRILCFCGVLAVWLPEEQRWGTMQYSASRGRTVWHPRLRRWFSYCASAKWWQGCCMWKEWMMQHSSLRGWKILCSSVLRMKKLPWCLKQTFTRKMMKML